MAISPGTHKLGPSNATLTIYTYRTGVAQKVGHDLVLQVTDWEATVTVEGDSGSGQASADSKSIEVREGHNGLKPLSDKDRADIKKNIDGKVLGGQPVRLNGGSVHISGDRLDVSGDLEMAGNARPVSFALDVGAGGKVSGRFTVVQSEWGIKPYTGLMGALKVKDEVEIEVEGTLPAS